jgi:hypothetical protein
MGDEFLFEQFGAVNKRQCADGGSVLFLDGADCALDFGDMFVCGGDVYGNGHLEEPVAEAGEFFVRMCRSDLKTSGFAQVVCSG